MWKSTDAIEVHCICGKPGKIVPIFELLQKGFHSVQTMNVYERNGRSVSEMKD